MALEGYKSNNNVAYRSKGRFKPGTMILANKDGKTNVTSARGIA